MRVTTNSVTAVSAQRLVIDLMLSTGKHDCLSCEQNGICELQDSAYHLGIESPTFRLDAEAGEKDTTSEFICKDDSKCVTCGRCVVGCNTTVVNEVLDFGNRGGDTKVICDDDKPMGSSSCVQCGECVQLCLTGAMTDKLNKGKGRPWELDIVETVCPYCGVGCKLNLHVDKKANKIVRVTGTEGAPTNDGMLCVKGRYGMDFVSSPERLTKPLVRNAAGELEESTWDHVIPLIADKFNKIKAESGSDAIAGLASAKVSNEENYVFQKFMRAEVGTHNVDHCARL
jgi:formate dehydrogenase major subunit